MRSRRPLLVLAAAIAGSFPCAQAHHGQEFLVVQDAAVPSLWTGVAFGSLEWSKDGDDNTFSTEPGVMVGIAPRVAIGGTVGFTDENGSWAFESVAPTMQIQLTPSDWRVRVSVVAGYHFAYCNTVYVAVLYPKHGSIGGIITALDQNRHIERDCSRAHHPHVENTGYFG